MTPPTLPILEIQKDFARRLALMKEEAMRLGLYETMQLMDVPLGKLGYEMAEQIDKRVSTKGGIVP